MPLTRVTTNTIKDSALTSAKIADGSVTTAKIADSQVTTAKIADNQITTAKIADSNITAGKIADANITAAKIADGNVSASKLSSNAKIACAVNARTSGQSLGGDSGWNDHLSVTFTASVACRIHITFCESCTYESGPVQGFGRFLINGTKIGYNFCLAKQSTANSGAAGSATWAHDVGAGTHTVMVQIRNSVGGSTWITPYWSVDGETSNTLSVTYYS